MTGGVEVREEVGGLGGVGSLTGHQSRPNNRGVVITHAQKKIFSGTLRWFITQLMQRTMDLLALNI
jgi:hypothetical protein